MYTELVHILYFILKSMHLKRGLFGSLLYYYATVQDEYLVVD